MLFIVRKQWNPDVKAMQRRLERYQRVPREQEREHWIDITRKQRLLSLVPGLHAIFSKVPVLRRYDHLVMQADVAQPLGFFILMAPLLFFCGYFVAILLTSVGFFAFAVGIAAGLSPSFYLLARRRRRTYRFQEQLPEALDLLSRSLHAGHAFSGALHTVAEEFDAPIGIEFRRVVNEINYGVPADRALRNLAERVAVDDLKFFTISIIIHRESGGNLADILDKMAHLIRERFKLQGKIKALSAEGKFSAGTLVILPFVVALAIFLLNPEYARVLTTDPLGRALSLVALSMMGLGMYVIKQTITIKG